MCSCYRLDHWFLFLELVSFWFCYKCCLRTTTEGDCPIAFSSSTGLSFDLLTFIVGLILSCCWLKVYMFSPLLVLPASSNCYLAIFRYVLVRPERSFSLVARACVVRKSISFFWGDENLFIWKKIKKRKLQFLFHKVNTFVHSCKIWMIWWKWYLQYF